MPFFEDLLRILKGGEYGYERLSLLDDEMVSAAVAWQFVNRTITINREADDPWSLVQYDPAEWADLAQLQVVRLRKAANRLIKMRLIYPDGTLPKEVLAFVKSQLGEKMGVRLAPVQARKKELSDDRT